MTGSETEATVPTKLGDLFIRANGKDCITLMLTARVRGISYDVLLYADKKNIRNQWYINSNFSSVYRMERGLPGNGVSRGTHALIVNTCQAALDEWLKTNAAACEETPVQRLTRELGTQEQIVFALQIKLEEAEKKFWQLDVDLAAAKG